jgi:hypothetical protein
VVARATDDCLLVLQQACVGVGRGLLARLSVRVCVGRHFQPSSDSACCGPHSSAQASVLVCSRGVILDKIVASLLRYTHYQDGFVKSSNKAAHNDLCCAYIREPDSVDGPVLSPE